MFNPELYSQLKKDVQLAYQCFNNLPANCTEDEMKLACDNLNTKLGHLNVFLHNNKNQEREQINENS